MAWSADKQGGLRVLLVTRIAGLEQQLRQCSLPGVDLLRTREDADTARAITSAEVVIADPVLVAHLLNRAAELQWLQSTFAGVEILFRASARRDYRLTRIKRLFGPMMAEYTLAHILARERHLLELARQQQQRRWEPLRYRRLSELTLGILGVGDIGGEVARMAGAFGMTVWGLRSRPEPAPAVDRVFTPDQLADFLAGPDYLVNILPSTPATRDLLSGETLSSCRPSAVLINIGRGDIIDEASLVRAVQKGWITGAVLDVFQQEPLPEGSPLWDLPGVTITPHVAALGISGDIAAVIADNLARYRAGEPLNHLVDWGRGY